MSVADDIAGVVRRQCYEPSKRIPSGKESDCVVPKAGNPGFEAEKIVTMPAREREEFIGSGGERSRCFRYSNRIAEDIVTETSCRFRQTQSSPSGGFKCCAPFPQHCSVEGFSGSLCGGASGRF